MDKETEELIKSRFKASIQGLLSGDVLVCNRDNKRLLAVVIERHEEKGIPPSFTISRFSPILNAEEYPKRVSLDKDGWLVDTSGAIVLLPDEWENTEKDEAKELVSQRRGATQRAQAIFLSIKDRRMNLFQKADVVLKNIGHDSPSNEARALVAFALQCAAGRVWELE
jgi:hypothetical protein